MYGGTSGIKGNNLSCIKSQENLQDRQCTYNATLERVPVVFIPLPLSLTARSCITRKTIYVAGNNTVHLRRRVPDILVRF
jgi:hypothetical protein